MISKQKLILLVALIVIIIIVIVVVAKSKSKSTENEVLPEKKKTSAISAVLEQTIETPVEINLKQEDSTVHLTWKAVPDADFYTVYYARVPFNDPEDPKVVDQIKVLKPINLPDVKITSAAKGDYYFRISSSKYVKKSMINPLKREIESELSSRMMVNVNLCSTPNPPKDIKFEVVNDRKDSYDVRVTWKPVAKAEGYRIHLNSNAPPKGDDSDYHTIRVDTGIANGHLLTGLSKKDDNGDIVWYLSMASYEEHCGAGVPGDFIKLTEKKLPNDN